MKKPNLFIVGAPKCGTTALAEYLKTHPQIFMSTPKEPHFFADDMVPYSYTRNFEEYLKLFEQASSNHKIIGEASVLYLYSDSALINIKKNIPDAKIIVMLRRLDEYIYSYHNQLVNNTDENVTEFRKAWSLEKFRKKNIDVPKYCRIHKLLYYREVLKLGSQLERLYNIFPKKNVHVILMDDFKKDTINCYKNVLDFLEIEYDGRENFPKINANRFQKSQKLKLIQRSSFFKGLLKVKKTLNLKGFGLLKKINNINTIHKEREPLDKEMRSELILHSISEIEKLEKLLNKDLSHWKK